MIFIWWVITLKLTLPYLREAILHDTQVGVSNFASLTYVVSQTIHRINLTRCSFNGSYDDYYHVHVDQLWTVLEDQILDNVRFQTWELLPISLEHGILWIALEDTEFNSSFKNGQRWHILKINLKIILADYLPSYQYLFWHREGRNHSFRIFGMRE